MFATLQHEPLDASWLLQVFLAIRCLVVHLYLCYIPTHGPTHHYGGPFYENKGLCQRFLAPEFAPLEQEVLGQIFQGPKTATKRM